MPVTRRNFLSAVAGAKGYGAAFSAMQARLNRGFGRALDEQLDTPGFGEILRVANITMAKLYATGRQSPQGQFATSPLQVVKRDNSAVRVLALKRQGQMRADKTGSSSD